MTTLATDAPALSTRSPRGPVRGVALVMHGGKADSLDPTTPGQLTVLRMIPFARSLHAQGARHGLEVVSLRYRVRGWNGSAASPTDDARWALDEIRRRHGDVPVALVGHSMGGRTALRIAGDPAVRSVTALAPWAPESDPVEQLAGRDVLIAHGNLDVVTSPRGSLRFAYRAAAAGAQVRYRTVRGDMHAMLFRWHAWHALTTTSVLASLGFLAPSPRQLERAGRRGGSGKNPDVRSM